MITGPLGLRVNRFQKKDDEYKLCSPSWNDFIWESNVVWASCDTCPKDSEGHVQIEYTCSCGIYMSHNRHEIDFYFRHRSASSVLCLCEALDALPSEYYNKFIWLHDRGITAPGALVVAVVRSPEHENKWNFDSSGNAVKRVDKHELVLIEASKYFKAPILPYTTAVEMIKEMWAKQELEWKGDL